MTDVCFDEGKGLPRKISDPFLFHGAGVKGIEVVDGSDAIVIVQ
jgi:hypothetical protein